MSFARVSSVLKGLGGSGVAVKESKDIMCVPDTYLAEDDEGNVINEFLEKDTSFMEKSDTPLEDIAKSEKYKKSAALVLRGSMMLVGLGLSIYVMAEKGGELYQFIESFNSGAAGQRLFAATVTGITLTILPAGGVSAGKPVAKLIEAGSNKLSYCINYAKSIFKNEKESKKDDDVVDRRVELAWLIGRRSSAGST